MTWLAVALAGGLGAAARYLVDHAMGARASGVMPWGTLAVNVSGSLAAGAVGGLVATGAVTGEAGTVLAGGFVGGYTTFSTAMYETARLFEDGAGAIAVVDLVVPLVGSVSAAWLGWSLVTWMGG